MDGDGDMDIISASTNDDTIAWYENNGAADPSWTKAVIATNADGAICLCSRYGWGWRYGYHFCFFLVIAFLGMRTMVTAPPGQLLI